MYFFYYFVSAAKLVEGRNGLNTKLIIAYSADAYMTESEFLESEFFKNLTYEPIDVKYKEFDFDWEFIRFEIK